MYLPENLTMLQGLWGGEEIGPLKSPVRFLLCCLFLILSPFFLHMVSRFYKSWWQAGPSLFWGGAGAELQTLADINCKLQNVVLSFQTEY